MSTKLNLVKVLEECRISPPPNSAPKTLSPLTCFDISWIKCCPIQRVFLYQVPFSLAQFTEEILPQLKNSLSLALQRFFLLCGNFALPPQPSEPYILYEDGDSVPLLVAHSTGNFSDFLTDRPKDALDIHPLVPKIPLTRYQDELELTPLVAVQLTLFPNSGLCVGITFRHVVADGTSFNHFVKTWASIFKANCDMSNVTIALPVLDRNVIKDPEGIKNVLLDQWRANGSPTWNETPSHLLDTVRATFTLSRVQIDQLKRWVAVKCGDALHLSSFVVTSAFIWVCYIKSLDALASEASNSSKTDELCRLGFLADCRNKYGTGIPSTFFGNCLIGQYISSARSKFKQEGCIADIAAAVSAGVQSFKHGMLDRLKTLPPDRRDGESVLTVAGSPRLMAYETDFGWGKPAKTEVVHIDISDSVALSESISEKGGIEIGICRSRRHMDIFSHVFQSGVKQFM